VSSRNTGNWFSRTVPSCRKEKISAFFPRTPGGLPIWREARLPARRPGLGRHAGGCDQRDLAKRSLVKIRIEDIPEGHLAMAMSAVFRADRPPGPAGRWLIERLKSNAAPRARPAKARRRP